MVDFTDLECYFLFFAYKTFFMLISTIVFFLRKLKEVINIGH